MSDYTFEQCRKAFAACADLAAIAPTPIERRHWRDMKDTWKSRMVDAQKDERSA
jgi:hypothetical protein